MTDAAPKPAAKPAVVPARPGGGTPAAAAALWPATSTCTSAPMAAAAVTVFKVAPLMEALSCSAITRDVMCISPAFLN